MTTNYMIKNCPAIRDGRNIQNICTDANACCELVTDCLIKQVIEKCNEQFGFINSDYREGQRDVALNILQLFEIEEVNNDR